MPQLDHYRATFSGVFGTVAAPVEQWSWGFAIDHVADPNSADPAAGVGVQFMPAYAAALRGFWGTHMRPLMHSAGRLTRVRLARVGTDGRVPRTTAGQYQQGDWTGDDVGTGTGVLKPLQIACVVSLETDRQHASGRGRFFLPAPIGTPDGTTGLMGTNDQATLLAGAVGMLNAVNAWADTQNVFLGPVVVASSGSAAAGLAPANPVVRAVKVGRVFDTMRSRRSDLGEARVRTVLA